MKPRTVYLLGSLVLVFLVLINSLFVVRQSEQALILRLGEPRAVVTKPGINYSLPFVERDLIFEKRILHLNAEEREVIASDQKRLIVTAFAKYRIDDPLEFFQTVRDEYGLRQRLSPIVDSSLRQILGSVPLASLLTGERAAIMANMRNLVNTQSKGLGIEVVDVRIMRADLPAANSEAIYSRMQTEREREAKEFRAQGEEEALAIRARTAREVRFLGANAERESQIIRGQGDAKALEILNAAAEKDPEFYSFYRSLHTYRQTLNKDDTTMLLTPNSPFLKYLLDERASGQ